MAIDLVLGLGNPGARYAETRHNVGFRVVEALVRRLDPGPWARFPLCELRMLRSTVVVARPLTYMNRSGAALAWLLGRFAVDPRAALVVVDDIDLPLGRLRLRARGGPGTHNGLRDLCREVGNEYPRLRVGVRSDTISEDLADWVTSPFDDGELEAAELAIERAADAVEAVLTDGLEPAMNEFNRSDTGEGSREA